MSRNVISSIVALSPSKACNVASSGIVKFGLQGVQADVIVDIRPSNVPLEAPPFTRWYCRYGVKVVEGRVVIGGNPLLTIKIGAGDRQLIDTELGYEVLHDDRRRWQVVTETGNYDATKPPTNWTLNWWQWSEQYPKTSGFRRATGRYHTHIIPKTNDRYAATRAMIEDLEGCLTSLVQRPEKITGRLTVYDFQGPVDSKLEEVIDRVQAGDMFIPGQVSKHRGLADIITSEPYMDIQDTENQDQVLERVYLPEGFEWSVGAGSLIEPETVLFRPVSDCNDQVKLAVLQAWSKTVGGAPLTNVKLLTSVSDQAIAVLDSPPVVTVQPTVLVTDAEASPYLQYSHGVFDVDLWTTGTRPAPAVEV